MNDMTWILSKQHVVPEQSQHAFNILSRAIDTRLAGFWPIKQLTHHFSGPSRDD
jgi:hypothetical protein